MDLSTEISRKLRRNASPPEQAMWRLLWHLRQQGWNFRRQVQLGRYYVDFACLSAKVVIEVDGDTHTSDAAIAADAERDEYLRSVGFIVLRYWNNEVMTNPDGVFTHLAGVLSAVSRTVNTPTPVPSPQGGGRRSPQGPDGGDTTP